MTVLHRLRNKLTNGETAIKEEPSHSTDDAGDPKPLKPAPQPSPSVGIPSSDQSLGQYLPAVLAPFLIPGFHTEATRSRKTKRCPLLQERLITSVHVILCTTTDCGLAGICTPGDWDNRNRPFTKQLSFWHYKRFSSSDTACQYLLSGRYCA